MGSIANMERRMASGATADSWYNPGGFFYGGPGGGGIKTKSGSHVSEMNAMQLSVVWSCIKMLSEDTASLPLELFRRRKSGPGKDIAYADERYFLLHDQPNPEMTAMSFRETYAAHLLSWGNGYAEIERTKGAIKKPAALWPITPNRVTVKRDDNRRIVYHISMAGSNLPSVVLSRENIFHTPGLSFNGLIGYSPIASAREAIGLGMTLEEFGSSYFENGIRPSFIISSNTHFSDPKTRREALEEVYGGLGNVHRIMLLEESEKVERIGIPNDEAQFLETRKYTNTDIGTRIYRFPPQMYGEFENASTYASVEQFSTDYVTKTLRPWLVRLEQSFNMALLDPSERGEYFFEHNVEGLLRGDILTRYQAYTMGKRNGWLNADEIRGRENMNPIPDGKGAEYIIEKNMIGLSDLGSDVVPQTVGK